MQEKNKTTIHSANNVNSVKQQKQTEITETGNEGQVETAESPVPEQEETLINEDSPEKLKAELELYKEEVKEAI